MGLNYMILSLLYRLALEQCRMIGSIQISS